MTYAVCRQKSDGQIQQIATAMFLSDAETVLDRWHAGYITSGGAIIKVKNMKGLKVG